MSPADAALLANVHAEADSGAHIVVVGGRVAIFYDEIVARSDDELLAFIAARLADQLTR